MMPTKMTHARRMALRTIIENEGIGELGLQGNVISDLWARKIIEPLDPDDVSPIYTMELRKGLTLGNGRWKLTRSGWDFWVENLAS